MKTIKVLGYRDERLKSVGFGTELKNFSISDAVLVSTDRASASYQQISDVRSDDVVELIFEDDIHRWVTLDELEKEYKYSLLRGETAGVIEIPAQLPTSGGPQASRGVTAWALKGLRVLKFDPAEKAASEIAEGVDGRLMREPGLYRFEGQTLKRGARVDQPEINTAKPVLLLLHGTFSSTQGSFGKLPPETLLKLSLKYGDQIFGYEHYTLSLSPIQNALDLVKKLPENATLHLLTHSRGGLIGELLSRSARMDKSELFDQDDRKLTADFDQGDTLLAELERHIKAKNIRVERMVRVACPARGTTLASGRIDRWLEIIVNVLAKVLDSATGNIVGVLTDLLLEFKKQVANPQAMPGLAAMVPESGFIRMINRPDVLVDMELFVIAGDVEKNDILGRLAVFFTDLFYSEDHDLVVQTRAMYGGTPNTKGLYYFHKGTDVNHFHYFSNPKTAQKIVEALAGEPTLTDGKGFRPLFEAYRDEAIPVIDLVSRSFQKRSHVSQPVVYVVPGIMGTHLALDEKQIWLNLLALARGGIANLQISSPSKVRPHALVALAYGHLVEYLSATHEVIPFPYDWRLSILKEGERFGNEIAAKLQETKEPIRIIAHSMGGLVTRSMIAQKPEVWEEICRRPGSRFAMLGTPNLGAHKIIRLLLGQDSMLRMLAMLDIKNSPSQLLHVIARFPGVLQLMPMDDDRWNFLDEATWNKFPNTGRSGWVKPQQADLDEAKQLQATLMAQKFTEKDPVVYIAGFDQGAPTGVELGDDGRVVFRGTNEGDGTVPWRSGILPELETRTWYMPAPHGDMANHRDSFAAIYELLLEGKTNRLSTVPFRVARGVEETYVLPEDPVHIYPDQVILEQTVLGATPVPLEAPAAEPVRVSVAHGNLSFCNNPVAVGHYEGDGIFSAEKHLDYHLKGRLTTRHRLGLYPGPEGTAEVILNEGTRKPGGAIIVGLGKAGELSPRKLTLAFANAMREYAIKMAENPQPSRGGNQDRKLSVSTLLIGSGGQGLTIANSVDSILNGVAQANKSFSQVEGPLQNMRIVEIQFIELYKDQAILAARALATYRGRPEFAVDPLLRTLRGGFQRLAYEEPAGWWNRIYVRAGTEGSLIFTLPTDRARSEEPEQGLQRTNIDNLVAQAVKDPSWDQDLATSMFELMVPNRLKSSFRDLNNVLFVLDREAARYPWELLYDRRTGQDKPLVVQVGMVRQFSTSSFQERVVDVNNKNVLVVGNPSNMPPGFSDLPGAQQEASLVASKFNEFSYEVTSQINTGSNAIMNSLFSKDYRVLHLAGHGVFRHPVKRTEDEKPKFYTGMVLGNNIFLTANEIRNKTDIPELVFINCCHLGQLDPPTGEAGTAFNELAASFSEKLIEMGVKAVIAAGWAVDDAAALTFAEVFYDNLLKGSSFGEAVRAARVDTYKLHQDRTNTWAAYQCYGDPDYRLVPLKDGSSSEAGRFVALDEAVTAIRTYSDRAKTTSAQGILPLKEGLELLQKRINTDCPDWLGDSSLQEALGEAFAEMFWFDKAIEYYQAAIQNKRCSASLKAIEQLSNCRIRFAVQTFEKDPVSYEKVRSEIEREIKTLNTLMQAVGETSERKALVGSGYKRLARISAGDPSGGCEQALREMGAAYMRAWELDPDDPYPLTNALTANAARLLRAGEPEEIQEELPKLLKGVEQAARLAEAEKANAPDDFWASIGISDVTMVEALVSSLQSGSKGLSAQLFDSLIEDYKQTWARYGSARELNSVIEHYAFLESVLGGRKRHKALSGYIEKTLSSLHAVLE